MFYPPREPTQEGWFAVLNGGAYIAIGFDVVAIHRAQIEANQGASLEELNASGGCDWYELYCGMTKRGLFPTLNVTTEAARAYVLMMAQEHALRRGYSKGARHVGV